MPHPHLTCTFIHPIFNILPLSLSLYIYIHFIHIHCLSITPFTQSLTPFSLYLHGHTLSLSLSIHCFFLLISSITRSNYRHWPAN
ncbi:hypothetical protein L6452_21019 [Arctium lappa]|uniref:Uncharacterized protein n=1 Tax=Arctium lappa TaxID=4217 RepID=A0ACB9BCK1_ARCLA|nr:hypothetical protein L6452_21019 [Arctium lappa]